MHFDLIDLRLYLHILDAGNITAGASRSHLVPGRRQRAHPRDGSLAGH